MIFNPPVSPNEQKIFMNILIMIQNDTYTLYLIVQWFIDLKWLSIRKNVRKIKRIENELWNWSFNAIFLTMSAIKFEFCSDVKCFDCDGWKPRTMYISNHAV